jgi:hypothetical protein
MQQLRGPGEPELTINSNPLRAIYGSFSTVGFNSPAEPFAMLTPHLVINHPAGSG